MLERRERPQCMRENGHVGQALGGSAGRLSQQAIVR